MKSLAFPICLAAWLGLAATTAYGSGQKMIEIDKAGNVRTSTGRDIGRSKEASKKSEAAETKSAPSSPVDICAPGYTWSPEGVSPQSADRVLRDRLRAFGHDLRAGLTAARGEPVVLTIIAFTMITCAGEGIMGTLFAPFVRDVLHGSGQVYGVITGVQAVGGIVGGVVAAGIGHRWSPTVLFGVGAVLFGCVDLAIFLYPLAYDGVWPAVVGMLLVGVPGAVTMAGYMTLFQRHTADAERGRVFSLLGLGRAAAVLVGTTTAGFLGETVGIVPILALQGVGYVLAGAMVLVALRGYVHERPGTVRLT